MIIETERLILRPFIEADAADAYEYLHEPTVHCFACMKVNSLKEAKKAVLERAKDGEYYFAITLKENGKVRVGVYFLARCILIKRESNALHIGRICFDWCYIASDRCALKRNVLAAHVVASNRCDVFCVGEGVTIFVIC